MFCRMLATLTTIRPEMDAGHMINSPACMSIMKKYTFVFFCDSPFRHLAIEQTLNLTGKNWFQAV